MHEWMAGTQFSSAVSYEFCQAAHINLLEFLAHKTWAKRAAKDRRMWNKRHARIMDSGVVCGCVAKGRPPSFRLNFCL